MKKRKEAANEEAKLALQEYDLSMKQLEDTSGADISKASASSGRRVFGAAKPQIQRSSTRTKRDIDYGSSSGEDDFKTKENIDIGNERSNDSRKDADIDVNLLREESEIGHDPLFKVICFLDFFELSSKLIFLYLSLILLLLLWFTELQ